MNRTKIEWTFTNGKPGYTWNPVTGCLSTCSYCYARAIYKRFKRSFKPRLHKKKLGEPDTLRKPSKIFVCSTGDLFGYGAKTEWRDNVMEVVSRNPRHTFIFLSKSLDGLIEHGSFPRNAWVGLTLDCGLISDGVGAHAAIAMHNINARVRFINFEPLLGEPYEFDAYDDMDWCIIGGLTGPKKKQPKGAWVSHIMEECEKHNVPVFLKNNLKWNEKIQTWPI